MRNIQEPLGHKSAKFTKIANLMSQTIIGKIVRLLKNFN